jgi:phenylacetic acid degradation operon negative regulatory protein
MRKKRHSLRTQLSWLGFGSLSPGTWISPHDRTAELTDTFSVLDVKNQVDIFSGVYLGPDTVKNLVARCWNLNELECQYQDFISRIKHDFTHFEKNGDAGLSPDEHFVNRFWLTHEFQTFTLNDPNLPSALLPEDWVGYEARQLFTHFYQALGPEANRYVDSVMNQHNGKF